TDGRLVHDGESIIAFLDKRPLFPGHVLVVPRMHVATIDDVDVPLLNALFHDVRTISRAVERATGSQGTFIALNNKVSQSVPHVHVHVVPRSKGDGLRGFFWPRNGYRDETHADEVQAAIRQALQAGE
ncbi:MAG: HIT family protein, partial [Rhodothermales bacterium]|nr:HIT family protein [Rhodothermales bacterium]